MSVSLLEGLKCVLASSGADQLKRIRVQTETLDSALASAIDVWQAYLDSGRTSDCRFSAVMWLGAEASMALHASHLVARAAAVELTALTKLPFADLMSMTEEVSVIMAYDALGEGETVPSRANVAIETMKSRRQALQNAVAG